MLATLYVEPAATCAFHEARQQIFRVRVAPVLASPMRLSLVAVARGSEPTMHLYPQIVADDPCSGCSRCSQSDSGRACCDRVPLASHLRVLFPSHQEISCAEAGVRPVRFTA